MGAALQGGILAGDIKDIVLLDVTALSLGVETHGGLFHQVDRAQLDDSDPEHADLHHGGGQSGHGGGSRTAGRARDLAENKSLGRFELVGVPPAPRGVPQIEVAFAIDSNGMVNVSARDLTTNKSQSIQVNPASGLSENEIERLVSEAQEFATKDGERRELRRLRNRLEGLIYTNDKVFRQFQDMMEGEVRKEIHDALLRARTALSQEDHTVLEAAVFDLNTLSQKLSEMMLDDIDAYSDASS